MEKLSQSKEKYKNIYSWEAHLFNGQVLCSPIDDQNLKDYECLFINLPFPYIKTFELKPLHHSYAPIRIQTNGRPFKYFRRWDKNLLTQEVLVCWYILETEEKVYVIKWPGPEYKIFKNIEEFNKG